MKYPSYSPKERARAKQRTRDEDERVLAEGRKSREQVRYENGAFVFPNIRIDLIKASLY